MLSNNYSSRTRLCPLVSAFHHPCQPELEANFKSHVATRASKPKGRHRERFRAGRGVEDDLCPV